MSEILLFDHVLNQFLFLQEVDPPISWEIFKNRFLKNHGLFLMLSCSIAWVIGLLALKSADRLKILFPNANKSILAWSDLFISIIISLAVGLFIKQPDTYNEAMAIGAGATTIYEVFVSIFQNNVGRELKI